MTDQTNTPAAAPTTVSAQAAAPALAPASGQPPTGNGAAAPAVQSAASGTPAVQKPTGLFAAIKWLNFYAEDLLAPISPSRRRCERCNRKMWRGYFLSAPTGVSGVSDMQIVCWRCKLAAAQQEMAQLRTSGRR